MADPWKMTPEDLRNAMASGREVADRLFAKAKAAGAFDLRACPTCGALMRAELDRVENNVAYFRWSCSHPSVILTRS